MPAPFDAQILEQVNGRADRAGAVAQQLIRTLREGARYRARHDEDVPSLIERVPSSDQRAASASGLDHDDGPRQTADQPVSQREMGRSGRGAHRKLARDCSLLGDSRSQSPMLWRIDPIDPTSEHRHGSSACLEGAFVGRGIDAPRHPGDDGPTRRGEIPSQTSGDPPRVAGGRARADDRQTRLCENRHPPPHEQHGRRVPKLEQQRGVGRMRLGKDPDPELRESDQYLLEARAEGRTGPTR